MAEIFSYSWLGLQQPYLDTPALAYCGNVVIGCYGGTTSTGSRKNEDGALVWAEESGSWEFAVILDAHNSSESAALILRTMTIEKQAIRSFLSLHVGQAFSELQGHLISRFQSPAFRTRCKFLEGEASCIIAARKGPFLWWLSIGDCQVYLFHAELAQHGQFALNQRNFFEWIGQANTFELPVACYSSGIRELRKGLNQITLVTDGVLESGEHYFSQPRNLFKEYTKNHRESESFVKSTLLKVKKARGRDSATMISWGHLSHESGLSAK
ncbi:MAG: protein phosphatase 2C domain-containing protein [Anaerolineales bacterium]|nr:protein phosphatase 2C domain-containing protein [Anaerolineales bacterium]